jgi:type I restriction enzyme S subunit
MSPTSPTTEASTTPDRPRYDEYEDSGFDWLGEIPSHWKTARVQHVANIHPSSVDKRTEEDETPVLLCNYTDVYYGSRITDPSGFMEATATDSEIETHELRRGDVLVTKDSEARDDIAVPALVDRDIPGVLCGYHLAQLRPSEKIDPAFLYYSFKAPSVSAQFEASATGITRYGLSVSSLKKSRIYLPPLDEQRAIAAFLDRETERIDALIEKKEQLIDLLEEKRTALISRVVTKGLDENVEMQDSGVEWLGEIPAHWETVPYKYVTDRVDVGIAEAATHAYTSEGVPIIRSTNIKPNRLETDDVLYIEEWFAEKNSSKYLRAGDILTVRTGEPGTSAVVPEEFHMAQCFTLLISTLSDGQHPDFYSYFLNSEPAEQMFKLEGWGTAQTNISVPILENLTVVEPPVEEQHKIVDYLDKETSEISDLINRIKAGISSLREYRTALISAAVTGQIDVRGKA